MAKAPPKTAKLPPPTAADCWRSFALWVIGVPLLFAGALAFVWFAFWASGSGGMSTQLGGDTATVLFWLAAIALMYPAMLFIWVSDLRAGLTTAREWEAMTPEARAAALVKAQTATPPKRRARKKG